MANNDLGVIMWREFPDGFPNLKVVNPSVLKNSDVIFIADFCDAKEIFRQLAVIYALPSYGINSLKVILPYFPTGTMDRVTENGEIVTAKTLARMLSVIPAAAHPAQIIIFDIHCLQEQFYFSDNVRVQCVSALDLLVYQLNQEKRDVGNVTIAFPDEGAYKRFGQYFKAYSKIICEKRRLSDKRLITIKEGNSFNKDIVIVDDLIMSGSTILECAKVLRSDGAARVSAYATHGIFTGGSWRNFMDNGINLYVTNSCPSVIKNIDKTFIESGEIKVLSLFAEIASATSNNN
jgi:ribose-phosphate pyrophosphokinase